MMFEDYKLEEEIDNDMLDATKELISQISGALETAINAENYPDVTNIKFSIKDATIFVEDTYSALGTVFQFFVKINTKPFSLFLDIDNDTLKYFDELNTLEEVKEDISEPNQEKNEDTSEDEFDVIPDELVDALESKENTASEIQDEQEAIKESQDNDSQVSFEEDMSKEETTSKTPAEDSKEKQEIKTDDNEEENSELTDEEKKNKKLKLLIIILGGVIGLLVTITIVLYFMGVFDEEEVVVENNTTIIQPSEQDIIIANIKNKQIEYKDEMVDVKKLNSKLKFLTKYEILEEDVVKKFQEDEKERLYQLKMQKLEEFAQNNKEESLFKSILNKDQNETLTSRFNDSNNSIATSNNVNNQLLNEMLTFIKVNPIEYKNFKIIIDKEKTKTTSISMCKDSTEKVYIYVGPMYINLETNNIIKAIKKNYKNANDDINLIQMSRKEFNEMCNF